MHNKTVHMVTFLLVIVGGLNWLLVGLLEMNLVMMIFGGIPMLERAVYVLVGLSAVYELLTHKKRGGAASGGGAAPAAGGGGGM